MGPAQGVTLFLLLLVLSWGDTNGLRRRLETYNVDGSKISTSGFSSGGAMTLLMHAAYSSTIMGAAAFAGFPYACSSKHLGWSCTADQVYKFMKKAASYQKIDPLTNFHKQKVFVFHGLNDKTVSYYHAWRAINYYKKLGADIAFNVSSYCAHNMPTDNYGSDCTRNKSPGINDCDWSGAYHALDFIYGDLHKPHVGQPKNGEFYEYNQEEFTTPYNNHSMDTSGFIYVPKNCATKEKKCRLHVVFHGCYQARQYLGTTYAWFSGYIEVAERNDIIMLFPQAGVDNRIGNPRACWDFWGCTGKDYVYKEGKQARIVKTLIDRVAGLKQ